MARVRYSVLDGIDAATLQAQLTAMQTALMQLQSGARVVKVSYAQGEGSRSVEYTAANIADLTQAILGVQTQLDTVLGTGVPPRRRPIMPVF